jgi:hypothetical protein
VENRAGTGWASQFYPVRRLVVKHELTACKMNYRSRAEPAFASLFSPDTSIHPTHKARVLDTLELKNATSSANLKSASSISGINISPGGGSSTEQGGLNRSYAQIEGSKDPMNTFSTWSAEPNHCFTQAVYGAPISTHSSGSQEPDSSWAQTGGSKDPMDTFSTWSAEPNEAFSTQRSSIGRLRRLRELEIAQRMSAKAGSSPALHCMRLDLNITTTVRHFLYWLCRALRSTRSYTDRC